MLRRLFIRNYALIAQTEINFSEGMNILTGETGAGKSILVGAIGLIMGKRADTTVVNSDEKCVVEAEFWLSSATEVQQILAAAEIEPDELDNHLTIRREITPAGKSRAFVNDTPVNLPALRAVTTALVDVHGQHDGVQLMDPIVQRNILDKYAGLVTQTQQFAQVLSVLRKLDRQIKELHAQEQEGRKQMDYYRFQAEELQKANLSIEEDELIEQEVLLLQNAETVTETLLRNTHLLYEGEQSVSIQLADAVRSLEKISHLSPEIATEVNKIQEARYLLEDAASELQRVAENTELDPKRLEYLNERQNTYNRLKLKYGVGTTAELIAILVDFEQKIGQFESIDDTIKDLEKEKSALTEQLINLGLALEIQRTNVAEELMQRVNEVLKDVGLAKAEFKVKIGRMEEPNGLLTLDGKNLQPDATGFNSVDFTIRTNPGMPFGNLGQIASGGEISRVMLALKTALAEKMQLSVLIFDEIDTGISGEVAMKVGRVMERLSNAHQLITITHLPQIASRKGKHFFIYKESTDAATVSRIRPLAEEERVFEIAKMMSGDNPTENIIQSARELVAAS